MKRAAKIYTALIFVFLFAPIVILLVFSFNEAKSLSVFSGFSLKWYQELFRDGETLNALKNTLILAVVASLVSTAMGTAAAVGMNRMRNKYLRAALDTATDIPMMNPDIITGHFADAHVRVLRPAARHVHESRLLVDARGAHHVLPAVCHHAGAAEAAADGPLAARGRDGSRLHAGACVFPRGSAGDPARHHHRHDHGLHALAR